MSRTLYIPLYGKARVSKQGIILEDRTAERIWAENAVPLGRKSKSKWLAYFMAMRARVFDDWVREMLALYSDALVLHVGCGLDGRVLRVGTSGTQWYDLDFPEVIALRKRYYSESAFYRMIVGDASRQDWLAGIPKEYTAVVVMEGISTYLPPDVLEQLLAALSSHFVSGRLMMDVYTELGVMLSKWKNPIADVGVKTVYGMKRPSDILGESRVSYARERSMTPPRLVHQLAGFDRLFFRHLFAGGVAKKLYRMYEYEW